MLRGAVIVTAVVVVLAYQVNASILDFAQLIKSLRNSKDKSNWKFAAAFKDPSKYEVSQDVLDELQTYVDRLESHDPILDIEADTDQVNEMKLEFDELRKSSALMKQGESAIDCGQYGCCPDYSKADSKGKKGCAWKLCADVFINTCNRIYFQSPSLKERECSRRIIKDNCPYTCGGCKLPPTPLEICQRKNPGGFCCWDGKLAKGPNGLGCKPCIDKYAWPCKLFKDISRGCESNAWRVRNFMITHCPRTCEQCTKV